MSVPFLTISLLALPFSLFSYASEPPSPWYIGAGLGMGDYSNGGNPQSVENERDVFIGTLFGGYQINSWSAIEAAYQYLGNPEATYTNGKIEAEFHQLALSTMLGYPVTDTLYPYARFGVGAWTGDTSGISSASADGFSPVLGAGLSVALTDNLALRLDYQYTDN
ncbi:outer membrane protein A precursor [Vibrio ponticus]|nr:outer membrane protein A precursor [Vibrio ponticus]